MHGLPEDLEPHPPWLTSPFCFRRLYKSDNKFTKFIYYIYYKFIFQRSITTINDAEVIPRLNFFSIIGYHATHFFLSSSDDTIKIYRRCQVDLDLRTSPSEVIEISTVNKRIRFMVMDSLPDFLTTTKRNCLQYTHALYHFLARQILTLD